MVIVKKKRKMTQNKINKTKKKKLVLLCFTETINKRGRGEKNALPMIKTPQESTERVFLLYSE